MQSRLDNEHANAVAEITAVAATILDDTTVLGVTGTLAAVSVTLDHLGGIVGDSTVLSGCNIGTVTLVDCYGVEVASSLDLSDNRMAAGVTETSGLLFLIEQIYAEIVSGPSGATITLDISGNAVPDAATMALIFEICALGSSITITLPGTVTGTVETVEGIAAQAYVYDAVGGTWEGATDDFYIYHNGTTWALTNGVHEEWVGPAASMAGDYVLAAHDTVTVTIA